MLSSLSKATLPKEFHSFRKFTKLNHITFSALDNCLADSTLHNIVDKYRSKQDGRGAWLEIDIYQLGEGCEETCASNAWDELNSLKLTSSTPGGAETFLNKWNAAIKRLEDLDDGTGNISGPQSSWKAPC